jgi:ABC-type multidrug transport system ATPase subunit
VQSLLANGIVIAWILTAGYIVTPIPVWVSWMRWLHPYFYGFNWQARTQFQGRVFACAGDGSIESSQCIGDNVLVGLRFDPNTPLWVFPLGLLGFILVIHVLALLILTTWHPGGQRHATQQHSMQVEGVLKESNEKAATTKQHQLLVQLQHVTLGVTTGSLLSRDSATQKKILDDINLEFAPGRLSGILGPSGAGKSSLLSLLSARLSHKDFHMTGRICLNDQPLSKCDVQRIAFVQQDDSHLLPALTVRETLHYSALLKLDHLPVRSRRARAEEVILQLGLKHCADNLIGGELVKGISGGEKRRVSLGRELLSDPAVLVADEPTSGLDAAQALSVIDCLRTVASTGTVVIASLHQPRSAIFNALDHIVLLAKGGRVVCCGTGTEVSKHFEAVGLAVPKVGAHGLNQDVSELGQHFGLADFYLDSITVNAQDKATQAKSSELVDTLVDNWRFKQNDPAVETATASSGIAATATQTHPIWNVLPVILPRNFKNLRRQSDVFVTRLANPPFLGLLFFLFFGRFSLAPSSVQSRIGFLQELSAMPFVGCLSAVAIYGNELGSFLHDYRSSGARYSAASFLATYTLIEVPMQLIGSFLFAVVSVFGMGLQHSVKDFFEFTVSVFAVINFGESVGILFGTWVQDALSVSLISSALSVAAQTSGIFR